MDSGCSKQGQTAEMEAEPSINAIGNDTATTGLTSCSPPFFPPPTKWSESRFSFMAIKYFILICSLVIHFLRTV